MSICTTAPPAFRKRTWSARNDSSVCCASMSRSPAAMARRVFLSRSTKWRRDDEPLEPQARCPSRIPSRTPRGALRSSRADSGPQVLPDGAAAVSDGSDNNTACDVAGLGCALRHWLSCFLHRARRDRVLRRWFYVQQHPGERHN